MSIYKPELFADRDQAIPRRAPVGRSRGNAADERHTGKDATGPEAGAEGTLARLRARIERIERGRHGAGPTAVPGLTTGYTAIDRALVRDDLLDPEEGLAGGAVHEIAGQAGEALLLRLLARLMARDPRPVLWILPWNADVLLHGPGLNQAGLDTDRLILVRVRRPADGLWAMEEGLRSGALAAAVGEQAKPPGLTASRRLQLAAETGGGFGFLLQAADASGLGGTALPDQAAPSALASRWRANPCPSEIADDGNVARRLDVALVRRRGGDGGVWRVAA